VELELVTFAELGDPIAEARAETLREVKQLLDEWEHDRHPVTRARLCERLESLKLLVRVES
jgi:hypothetical protein